MRDIGSAGRLMVFDHGRHEQRQADVSGGKKRSVHIVDSNDRAAMHKLSATNTGLRCKKTAKLRPQLHLHPFKAGCDRWKAIGLSSIPYRPFDPDMRDCSSAKNAPEKITAGSVEFDTGANDNG
ncbi:MAG: hypothetical protein ACLPTF_08590 [Steroidobacteraceae bacterium]